MQKQRIRVLVLVLLLALGATSMFANPDQEIYYDFYTDATMTTWCGYWYITCTGMQRGGCRTDYAWVDYGLICWP